MRTTLLTLALCGCALPEGADDGLPPGPGAPCVAPSCAPGVRAEAVTEPPTGPNSGGTTSPSDTDDTALDDVDPIAEACADPTPRITLGTGDHTYEPLSDGSPLTIVAGPQGGHHVLAAVRYLHLPDPSRLQLEVTVGGERVAYGDYTLRPDAVTDCISERTDLYGYLFVGTLGPGTVPDVLGGRAARFEAQVHVGQNTYVDAMDVVLTAP